MKSILGIIIAISIVFTSCGKYEEGPSISLKSKEGRLCKKWEIESITENGITLSPEKILDKKFYNRTMTYSTDGIYTYTYLSKDNKLESGAGKWAFENNKAEIRLSSVSGMETQQDVILRLTSSEFWYYYMDGSDRMEIHCIASK